MAERSKAAVLKEKWSEKSVLFADPPKLRRCCGMCRRASAFALLGRIRKMKPGSIFTRRDLATLGPRTAVATALFAPPQGRHAQGAGARPLPGSGYTPRVYTPRAPSRGGAPLSNERRDITDPRTVPREGWRGIRRRQCRPGPHVTPWITGNRLLCPVLYGLTGRRGLTCSGHSATGSARSGHHPIAAPERLAGEDGPGLRR